MKKLLVLTAIANLAAGALVPIARAQIKSSDSGTATSGETVSMEKFQVNGVPVDQVILPTARPFNSVFGTDDNIIDVPRNVTIISREQMDTIGIQDVTDFSKLTASSFTDSNFGAPGNPSIRGQSADLFVNGMRQRVTSNGNGIPVDFNAVESVNIVKGPATAVQGASFYVGGFADMITKQPYFDGYRGSMSYTIGSYDTNRWNVDIGGPIDPTLAYRFSYSGEWSNEYWNDAFKHAEAAYGALTWRPTKDYKLDFNAKIYVAKYSENFGIDRPTQLLIDKGLYQSGININNGAGVAPSDSQNSKYVEGSNTIAWGPLVPVNYHWRLQGPGSQSHGHEYNAQVIQTLLLGTDSKVVNNTFFSLTDRDTFGTHYYSEIIAPTWYIENRTEFIHTFTNLHSSVINTGVDVRYQHTKAYDDFFFEPADVWDLSAARSGLKIDSIYFPSTDFAATAVPGYPGRYATDGTINGDTNDSQLEDFAPYAQATWRVAPMLNIVTGARVDFLHFDVKDPLGIASGFYSYNPKASISVADPNLNGSVVYKITPDASAYVTYNFSENYAGADANGGGFAGLAQNAAGQWYLPKDNFNQKSSLYEAGVKVSELNNRLFASVALFQQSRQAKAQGQPSVTEKFNGLEFETNYQPDKHFYATFGYSLLVGSLDTPVPFQAYSTNQIPNGPPNPFASATQTTGKLRVPGYPMHTFNVLASYRLDCGLGLSANAVVTGPINNDYQGYLVIPWQETVDMSASYKMNEWELRLSVTNVFNQHNWTPAYPTYGLESIVPNPGAQFFATVKYKF